ncbi:hypothetical protein [Sulfurihydrogenibium sp.]|uniref:hypothetical protein n=1 Tax=Sulfurihydrogenibium sp. TaxID=2053621 RepID=UPI002602508B|nr:hypothetical protein [Sulfurihydrogenibium sp.]
MKKIEKIIQKELKRCPNLKLNVVNEKNNSCIFFDIGYGDKFFIYYLNIEDLEKLSDFSSYTVFKEILDRYMKVGYPKGFRTRFFINFSNDLQCLKKNLENIKKDDILLLFLLNNAGVGNEKLAVNNINKNLIKRLEKLIENNGLDTSLILDKDFNFNFEGINTLWLKPYPNEFYKILEKKFFSEEFKNKAVFTINLISKKIFE